jgi:hypothetical protein
MEDDATMLYPFTGWRRVAMAVLISPAIVWGFLVFFVTGHNVTLTVVEQPSKRNVWQRLCWLAAGAPDDEALRL